MTNSQRSITATVLILVIAVCSTFLVTQCAGNFGRFDVTQTRLFTLSDGSRAIIAKLQKPLTMKLFYSKSLVDRTGIDQWREINNLYYNVRDMLRSYERESGGKLRLEEYDPKAYSDAESEAERLEIQRLQDMGSEGLFFGMAVESDTGARQTVKVFDVRSQSQIEYQISEAIELSTQRKKSKIGVLSSLDPTADGIDPMVRQQYMMQGRQMPNAWPAFEVLKRYYDVSTVPAEGTTEIAADLDYLIVVHPKDLADEVVFAIDQFVMRGGKLILFVDPYAPRVDQPPQDPQNPYAAFSYPAASNLPKLLEAWGVRVPAAKYAGDRGLALQMQGRGGPQRIVGVMGLEEGRGVVTDVPIAQGIGQAIAVYFPGVIERTENPPAGIEITPILQTTAEGNTFTADLFALASQDADKINAKFSPGVTPVTIAARISGLLESAFPEGLPKSDANGDENDPAKEPDAAKPGEEIPGEEKPAEVAATPTHLTKCAEPNAVLVFADVDLLADGFAYVRFGPGMVVPSQFGNGALFNNAIDYLAGSTDLMSIRSRGEIQRRFDVVEEIEREADARSQDKIRDINADKARFQQELSELSSQATTENVGLLRSDAQNKKRELENKVREKERELIKAQRAKNEDIESLGSTVQLLNVVGVPMLVLLIGAGIWLVNMQRRQTATGGAA